jgi:predicted phage terminase large subunit-like protein
MTTEGNYLEIFPGEKINLDELSEEEKHSVLSLLGEMQLENCRNDFYSFVLAMSPLILPDKFVNGNHIKIICDSLQEVYTAVRDQKKKGKRLQIFLPPGSMKTVISSNLFPAWVFGNQPKWVFLAIGHSTEFARDKFGRPLKDLMTSDEYQEIFPGVTLRHDTKAAGRFKTEQGGEYYCTGAGSNIAGRRAHIALCDDVLSEQSAYSDKDRTKITGWYVPGLQSRLLTQGGEVIINTRWHQDDLSGVLLKVENKTKPWKVISVPAILDKKAADILGLEQGGSFWPELWPTERFLELKSDPNMKPHVWNALYMQNPTPAEGNIFKETSFQTWSLRDPPDNIDYVIASYDTAFSEKNTADFTSVQIWAIFHEYNTDTQGFTRKVPNMILLYAFKGRITFPELCKEAEDIDEEYRPDIHLVERKGSGISLIQELRLRGLPVAEYMPDRDKISRAHATTPVAQAGRIWIPEGKHWAADFMKEVLGFPFFANDDQVDAFTQAVLWMKDNYKVVLAEYENADEVELEDHYRGTRKKKIASYWSSGIMEKDYSSGSFRAI